MLERVWQPADESDCSLGSSRDHFADKVCGFSHWFALPIAAGFCPSLAFLFLHHVVEPTPIHFPLHKQTEIEPNVPREIEQDVATTGNPGWERGHSGVDRGRNEDLSGNRAKPTSRANPAPVTPSAFGGGLRFAVCSLRVGVRCLILTSIGIFRARTFQPLRNPEHLRACREPRTERSQENRTRCSNHGVFRMGKGGLRGAFQEASLLDC